MKTDNVNMPFTGMMLALSFIANGIVLSRAMTYPLWYWGLVITLPFFCVALYAIAQKKYSHKRRRKGGGVAFNNHLN